MLFRSVKTWAREAFVIANDIDEEELKKPTIRVELPVCADAKLFMARLLERLKKKEISGKEEWIRQCNYWKSKYPVFNEKEPLDKEYVGVYHFIHELSSLLTEEDITVVANGSASVVGSQTYVIHKGHRFLMNCGLSSMGYDLPAAIGACMANQKRRIICIAGDGSIQMNLQELQTIVTNKLPVVIFVINNQGYHQIRLTQKNIFGDELIGVGPESGDLGFPDFEKLAYAYGIPYLGCKNDYELRDVLEKALKWNGYLLCEIFTSTGQAFQPKSATKRLEDGTLFSPPLEDMAPFLPKDELKENMYIDLIE